MSDPLPDDPVISALSAEWQANERELQALKELRANEMDPASLERMLDERQDEIEYEIGDRQMKSARKLDE